jgi:hypothetical protein
VVVVSNAKPGRYWNGPDYTMQTYQGDLHFSEFKELPVFSSTDGESIGLEFKLDIFFTYERPKTPDARGGSIGSR